MVLVWLILLLSSYRSLFYCLCSDSILLYALIILCFFLGCRHYNNAVYARVGGVSNAELNKLELELLFLLDFNVMVSSRVFENYCLHLEKEMVVNGTGLKIERALTPKAIETEISIEDSQSFSPPQIVDYVDWPEPFLFLSVLGSHVLLSPPPLPLHDVYMAIVGSFTGQFLFLYWMSKSMSLDSFFFLQEKYETEIIKCDAIRLVSIVNKIKINF